MSLTPLDTFERALLTELRGQVATGRTATQHLAGRSVAIAALCLGAVGTTAALLSSPSTPAFAVEPEQNGDVVVTVHRMDDPQGLEHALAAVGVESVVTYDPKVTHADVGAGTFAPSWSTRSGNLDPAACSLSGTMGKDGLTYRLTRQAVESDAVLHIILEGSVGGPEAFQIVGWEGC